MPRLTAFIIDDMPQSIANLKTDLAQYCPQIEVIGEADGVVSGAKLLRNRQPDVLFLDIQLGDGSGFDLLEILPSINFKVIFITASDAFAIKAFRFSAVDYLLKPIDPDELMQAVAKIEQVQPQGAAQYDLLLDSMKNTHSPKRIALHTQEKIRIVSVDEIIRCEASGNYTQFFFNGKEKLLVTRTLKEFDQLLQSDGFLRVHQSHLINLQKVKEYAKQEGGYIVMQDQSHVPVSTRKKAAVIKLLESL